MNGTNMGSDPLNMKMLKPLAEVFRCPICSEFFNNCVMTSCSHDFCCACIKKRLATESDCPTCYEDIRESDLWNNSSMDKIVRVYKKLTSIDFLFCVVEFPEENQPPSVVPCAWLENDDEVLWCWFPTKDFRKHVLKKSSPEDGWNLFKVNVIHFSRERKDSEDHLKHYYKNSSLKISEYGSTPKKIKTSLLGDTKCNIIISSPGTQNTEVLTYSNVLQPTTLNLAEAQELPSPNSSGSQLLACGSCGTNSGLIALSAKVDKVMEEVGHTFEQVSVMKQTLTVLAERLNVQVNKIEIVGLPTESLTEIVGLPIESVTDLENIETLIENHEEFGKYVKFLGRFGGRDVKDVTRRILFALIEHSFATKLNWIGTHEKTGLKYYPRVLQLISAAVRETPATAAAKQREVEERVKRWMRTAPDRKGGRGTKRKKVASTSD